MQKNIQQRLEKLESAFLHKSSGFYFILPDGSKVEAEGEYNPIDIIAEVKTPPIFPVDYLYTGGDLDPISMSIMGTVIEMGKQAQQ